MARNKTSFKRGTKKARKLGGRGGRSRPSLKRGRRKKR